MERYPEIGPKDVVEALDLTIKHDNDNKLATFLAELSAYTEDAQLNIFFNAPSSSGKSFIPTSVAELFPQEDIISLGYVSPTAFFHMTGKFDKEKGQYIVDLERKVVIFLDQPHTMLLEHLRPLLSHDKKEIEMQITDKSQKYGLRTKKVLLKGYPVVIFCSAGLRLDEQEATRFLLLSPELTQEKLRASVTEVLRRQANPTTYQNSVELNPKRQQLKERIAAIKHAGISGIHISENDIGYIEGRFLASRPMLKPRHQRDVKRLLSLVKVFALLNLWHRQRDGGNITASRTDIDNALFLWDSISLAQDLSIPPYVYKFYEDIIISAFKEKNSGNTAQIGVSRSEITRKHLAVYRRPIDPLTLRQQLLPLLSQSGLIIEVPDPHDKRSKLIYPQLRNSELHGGVGNAVDAVKAVFGENVEVLHG
jgi:hypothetical protein